MDYVLEPLQKQFKGPPNTKREDSEAKRLAALDDKFKQEQREKELIKNALTGQPVNKKIIFDESLTKTAVKSDESKAAKSLFDDEDDYYDQEDNTNFDISNKPLSNKKEVKLIKLQSRFAHDPRFQVDERFLDDEDNDQEDAEGEHGDPQVGKTLDILEEVLGKPLKRKHTEEAKKQSSFILPRYDPTKPESQKFRIRKVTKLEPHQVGKLGEDKDEDERPEVSKKRFYEISESFKKEVSDQGDGQSFSLTKLFGSKYVEEPQNEDEASDKEVDDVDTDDTEDHTKRRPAKKSKIMDNLKNSAKSKDDFGKNRDKKKESQTVISRVDDDTSGNKEEISKTGIDKTTKSKKQGKISNPLLQYERFFLANDDPRLNEEPFFKPGLVTAHFESWKEKRLRMSTALTKRRRHVKHVHKLRAALETKPWDSKDKRQKKKYRFFKESTKKH